MATLRSSRAQSGYTLVEMLLAMAIFGFVLVIMASAFVRLIHFYQTTIDVRTTQQAAREVSDDITAAARQSILVTTPAVPTKGTGNQPVTAVCFFNSVKSLPDTNITGSGTIFYAKNGGSNLWSIQEEPFTVTDSPLNACPIPGVAGSNTQISSNAVSFIRFAATTSTDNRLVELDMVIAAAGELVAGTNITYAAYPAAPTCVNTTDNNYCSITNLQVAAEAREPQ